MKLCRFVPSHFEAPVVNYNPEQEVYAYEQVNLDGRIFRRQVVKTINRYEQEQGNNDVDFSLENQLAVGSLNLQHTYNLGAGNVDSVLSGVEAATSVIDSEIAVRNQSAANPSE